MDIRKKFIFRSLLAIAAVGVVVLLWFVAAPLVRPYVTKIRSLAVPKPDYSFKSAPAKSGFAYFNENKSGGFKILIGKQDEPAKPQARFEVGGSAIDFSLTASIGIKTYTSQKVGQHDQILWENVLTDTDVSYQVAPDGLKENIILKTPYLAKEAPTLSFQLDTTQVIPANPKMSRGMPLVFKDSATGQYRFHIERPYLIDAKGARFDALDYKLEPMGVADGKQKTASYEAAFGNGDTKSPRTDNQNDTSTPSIRLSSGQGRRAGCKVTSQFSPVLHISIFA